MRELGPSFMKFLLSPFGCGDVNQRPNEFQLARLIPNCMSSNLDMFNCAGQVLGSSCLDDPLHVENTLL